MPLLAVQLTLAPGDLQLWGWAWLPITGGLALRAWGVGHLGARSRTRESSEWSLVDTGPFAWVRNPLYLGNAALWMGVGLVGGSAWLGGWLFFLAVHYSLVVRWEEAHLSKALGQPYTDYLQRVPRWLPRPAGLGAGAWSSGEVLRGERSTWLAAAGVMGLLWLRSGLFS